MKTVSLSGALRAHVGKKDAKKQRREGLIPCVLYGGKEQVHFTLKELDFGRLIFTPEVYLINLTLDGKEYKAILQDVQYHPVTDKVLHADFLEIIPGKPIIVRLPVHFVGDVPGVIAGGRLVKKLRKILVKGLVDDMPDFIEINMSHLNIGDNITVKELKVDKLTFLENPNSVIVGVKTARSVVELELEEEEEGEEGAEEGGEGGEKPTDEKSSKE
ncbi:MAG: 50S ribosomal protein L25/general stress protein Ctc [Chlorobi bacterium]|nr:50S ribosomal protein L25/general stress protein Ctc [Chlorobiota bacterium]